MSEKFDKFFNDKTYLDANNLSFVMIRLGVRWNKEEGTEFLNKIRFSLKLPKTSDQLNLFLGGEDEEENSIANAGQPAGGATLGLRYFMPTKIDNLKTSLSAGIRGLNNPYVRARFEYPFDYDKLYIRPIQYLRYSYEDEFEEKTDLFFDYKSATHEMIRLHLQRETVYDRPGMLFYAGLIHLNSISKNEGLQTYISLAGATKNDIDPETVDYVPKTGINSYSVGALWRHRIFRDYLFYEVQPIVQFAQQYKYKANYILEFHVEFYFGRF